MPDYFTDITAQEAITCRPEDADVLIKALLGPEKAEDLDGDHGLRATHADSLLSLEYDRRSAEIYLFGEDHVDLDQIPQAFLSALGALLRKQGKEYLEFGYANTCTRHCPDSHGGGRFRIDTNGRIIEPRVVWPRRGKSRRKA